MGIVVGSGRARRLRMYIPFSVGVTCDSSVFGGWNVSVAVLAIARTWLVVRMGVACRTEPYAWWSIPTALAFISCTTGAPPGTLHHYTHTPRYTHAPRLRTTAAPPAAPLCTRPLPSLTAAPTPVRAWTRANGCITTVV